MATLWLPCSLTTMDTLVTTFLTPSSWLGLSGRSPVPVAVPKTANAYFTEKVNSLVFAIQVVYINLLSPTLQDDLQELLVVVDGSESSLVSLQVRQITALKYKHIKIKEFILLGNSTVM